MGRVRRYKKFKACDPFSKRGKTEVDTIHDEPPSQFEQRARRSGKRGEGGGDDTEDEYEKFLRREAKELAKTQASRESSIKKVESKREDESMKDFKTRLRHETRTALTEELKAMKSSTIKRKERLKERAQKKKAKADDAGGMENEFDANPFPSSAEGYIRASDNFGPSRFASPEPVAFGETLNRMPDLQKWKTELTKRMKIFPGGARDTPPQKIQRTKPAIRSTSPSVKPASKTNTMALSNSGNPAKRNHSNISSAALKSKSVSVDSKWSLAKVLSNFKGNYDRNMMATPRKAKVSDLMTSDDNCSHELA